MEQLSGVDSYFLYTERGNVYNHVASLGIYDPSTAPGGHVRFKDILRYFARRTSQSKVFRRRLVTTPHGVDRPYWIEDPELDLEFHIRHIALPQPGDWRQLMIQVARIHSRPLDRSRPLWEIYVIEGLDRIPGLPRGSFALLVKLHHSSVDGQAAAELLRAVHSISPAADPEVPGPVAVYAERDPNAVELYTRAVAHGVERAAGLSSLYAKTLSRVAGITVDQVARRINPSAGARSGVLPAFMRAPMTRFNQPVSANRVVEAVGLPLDAMQRARRKLEGATLNDLFLAVVGGALRRYLQSKEELPKKSLMALMPMSVRQGGNAAPGNQVGGVPVPVHTDIADPIARLMAVRADVESAKRGTEALGRGFLQSAMDELPNFVAEMFARYYVYPQLNITVSNVRGPDAALYVAGARLVHFYPISIATDYIGLNHTGFSYNGVMWITAVACRNMMPDPAFYADCLRASFDELIAALDALPAPGAAKRVVPGRAPRAQKLAAAKKAPAKRKAAAAQPDAAAALPAAAKTSSRSAAPAPRRRKTGGRNTAAG